MCALSQDLNKLAGEIKNADAQKKLLEEQMKKVHDMKLKEKAALDIEITDINRQKAALDAQRRKAETDRSKLH